MESLSGSSRHYELCLCRKTKSWVLVTKSIKCKDCRTAIPVYVYTLRRVLRRLDNVINKLVEERKRNE